MSISSELLRIQQNIASAYQAVVTKGGTLPATQDATHLPEAIATLGTGIVVPSPSTKSGSIKNQIDRLNEQIANAYNVCQQLGKVIPEITNSANLADCILSSSSKPMAVLTTDLHRAYRSGYFDKQSYVGYPNNGSVKYYTQGDEFEFEVGTPIYASCYTSTFGSYTTYARVRFLINGVTNSTYNSSSGTSSYTTYVSCAGYSYTIPANTKRIEIYNTNDTSSNRNYRAVNINFITE